MSDFSDELSSNSSVILDLMDRSFYLDSSSDEDDYGMDFDECEDVYEDDHLHLDMEKTNGQYYIGLCKYFKKQNNILFLNSVSPRTFFKHPFVRISDYLFMYTIVTIRSPKVHIMKLMIQPDDTYSVVVKTHWLRLVQRHWRNIYRERYEILQKRRSIGSIIQFQLTGKYPLELNSLPCLAGMMSSYKKSLTDI